MALSRLRTLEDFSFMVYRNLEQFLPVKMLRVQLFFLTRNGISELTKQSIRCPVLQPVSETFPKAIQRT